MKFDIVVGNPPYGEDKKGSSRLLHLNIMKKSLSVCTERLCFIMPSKPIVKRLETEWYLLMKRAVCTDIIPMGRDIFPTTNMENTAVYFIDRKADKDSYCRRLEVDEVIYNMIDDESHRLFIDRMCLYGCLTIKVFKVYFRNENEYESYFKKYEKSLKEPYYLNVNKAMGNYWTNAQWFSGKLSKIGVLEKSEEISFLKSDLSRKIIIPLKTRESGENLKNLMLNGLVLKYSLWLRVCTREIFQEDFKYVPDLDYTNIHSDEELLYSCGFTEEETTKVMDYLKHFDFSQNRNDLIRNFEK